MHDFSITGTVAYKDEQMRSITIESEIKFYAHIVNVPCGIEANSFKIKNNQSATINSKPLGQTIVVDIWKT